MVVTLLIISAIAILILSVMVSHSYTSVKPALAGDATAVGLADPMNDTLIGHNVNNTCLQNDWQLTTVTALSDAENMLDYLEAQGHNERELIVLGNSSFGVRWR